MTEDSMIWLMVLNKDTEHHRVGTPTSVAALTRRLLLSSMYDLE